MKQLICIPGFLLVLIMAQPLYAFDYPEPGNAAEGSKVWSENCTRCHNMRSPTDLRDDQWVTTMFHMRIRAGLTGQEARDVLTFMQNSNGRVVKPKKMAVAPDTTISIQAAKVLYENNCLACHGADGKGNIPGVPDFTDANGRLSKDDNELLSNIIGGFQTVGNPMPMPPRGGSSLSNGELSGILNYIKEAFKQ